MEVTGAGQFLPQLKQWVSLHPDHDRFNFIPGKFQ